VPYYVLHHVHAPLRRRTGLERKKRTHYRTYVVQEEDLIPSNQMGLCCGNWSTVVKEKEKFFLPSNESISYIPR